MTIEPPAASGEPGLFEMLVEAVDERPPGLHPVDVITGARRGFTREQAAAILEDPPSIALLTRQWRTRRPSPALASAAHQGDARSGLLLELFERTGQLVALRSRSQFGLAAATRGQGPEVLVDGSARDLDTTVVRRVFNDQGLVDIGIESGVDAVGSFPVVALYALDDDGPATSLLLFLLVPTEVGNRTSSHAEVRLRLDPSLTSDRLSLFPVPVQADQLTQPLIQLVSHSVRVAKLPWKEAWRQAARATPEGHPLRAAVLDGLTART